MWDPAGCTAAGGWQRRQAAVSMHASRGACAPASQIDSLAPAACAPRPPAGTQTTPLKHPQVLKRLPNLKKLDGIPVDVDERDAALAARGAA